MQRLLEHWVLLWTGTFRLSPPFSCIEASLLPRLELPFQGLCYLGSPGGHGPVSTVNEVSLSTGFPLCPLIQCPCDPFLTFQRTTEAHLSAWRSLQHGGPGSHPRLRGWGATEPGGEPKSVAHGLAILALLCTACWFQAQSFQEHLEETACAEVSSCILDILHLPHCSGCKSCSPIFHLSSGVNCIFQSQQQLAPLSNVPFLQPALTMPCREEGSTLRSLCLNQTGCLSGVRDAI